VDFRSGSELRHQIRVCSEDVKKLLGCSEFPKTLIILGSGFSGFQQTLTDIKSINLSQISGFPIPNVQGHGKTLMLGKCRGQEVLVLSGRAHMYEGFSESVVVLPIRVMAYLGVENLILTNAAGSVDENLLPGDVMMIEDHINLTGRNCLASPGSIELNPIFVDMGECYDKNWREHILTFGKVKKGVYVGLLGPNYETPAETRMLQILGANAVGMSTVQEAICARHLGLKVCGISFITNMAGGLGNDLDHQEVLSLSEKHRPFTSDLLAHCVAHTFS
jgi:purine-nucleoside phosphorylase